MKSSEIPYILIVPGSKTKQLTVPILGPILQTFYTFFGVEVSEDTWVEELKGRFESIPAEVDVFEWSGGISPFSIERAAHNLGRQLQDLKGRHIILFTKSLGGVVAEKASRRRGVQVEKIIQVATPHFLFRRRVKDTKIVNVYSPEDSYHSLAHIALYFGFGKKRVSNATNIEIRHMSHSGFNHNQEIEYRGTRAHLFDVYQSLIEN